LHQRQVTSGTEGYRIIEDRLTVVKDRMVVLLNLTVKIVEVLDFDVFIFLVLFLLFG